MQFCLRLQVEYKMKIYILTGNLKVAANGLEKMYRDTRDAGVIYIKFTQPARILPSLRMAASLLNSSMRLPEIN